MKKNINLQSLTSKKLFKFQPKNTKSMIPGPGDTDPTSSTITLTSSTFSFANQIK